MSEPRRADDLARWAKYDIGIFRHVYPVCPSCGTDFAELHPLANLVPHFRGVCKKEEIVELERMLSL